MVQFLYLNRVPDHLYHQYCALARALDVAGDRWTLLIVRELMPGPRRFTDLLDGLPGISRPLLTQRVRDLEREGVVARRDLPPPAARQIYELTDDGRELAAALAPLIRWGGRRLGRRQPDETFHTRWAAVAMVGLADHEAAQGVKEAYEYRVGDTTFHFTVDDGAVEVHDGPASEPAVVVSSDAVTWADLATGKTKSSAASAAGALTVNGPARAVKRLAKIFPQSRVRMGIDLAALGG
jgi:DNA-binding HxlR family transcriptional regulator/putative sterol carrier protein